MRAARGCRRSWLACWPAPAAVTGLRKHHSGCLSLTARALWSPSVGECGWFQITRQARHAPARCAARKSVNCIPVAVAPPWSAVTRHRFYPARHVAQFPMRHAPRRQQAATCARASHQAPARFRPRPGRTRPRTSFSYVLLIRIDPLMLTFSNPSDFVLSHHKKELDQQHLI